MSTVSVSGDECASRALMDRWFRQLDQRRIYRGTREWAVQITAMLDDEDALWIQIADDSRWPGSVLLRVRPTTSIEQAVGALASPTSDGFTVYPRVLAPLHQIEGSPRL
jgi:hypothetical protein